MANTNKELRFAKIAIFFYWVSPHFCLFVVKLMESSKICKIIQANFRILQMVAESFQSGKEISDVTVIRGML